MITFCLFAEPNMNNMTYSQIESKIMELLSLPYGGSHYFNVEDIDGNTVKIRVSDHSANRNNNGDTTTLSFISARCDQGFKSMTNEWVIDSDGYTDTFQSIEEILDWNDISNN